MTKRKQIIFQTGTGKRLIGTGTGRGRAGAPPPPPPPPTTNYRTFLNSLIGKGSENLTAGQVNNWEDVDLSTPQGNIIDEIAKKFNNNPNKLGIHDITYSTDPKPSYYGTIPPPNSPPGTLSSPKMDLASEVRGDTTKTRGPGPVTVGHELFHANDHQIDQLNPKVWQNLGNMAVGLRVRDLRDFDKSIVNIQNKIDPRRYFSKSYGTPNLASNLAGAQGVPEYLMPRDANNPKFINWPALFGHINTEVTRPAPPGGVPNQNFSFNWASEFPAFMMERLTQPWGTNQTIPTNRQRYGTTALSLPEARFLHSTLGDMATAYPATDSANGTPAYPAMNDNIMARRNSIADAYYPPHAGGAPGSGVPQAGFAHGGNVKAKPKKRNLFSYFNR